MWGHRLKQLFENLDFLSTLSLSKPGPLVEVMQSVLFYYDSFCWLIQSPGLVLGFLKLAEKSYIMSQSQIAVAPGRICTSWIWRKHWWRRLVMSSQGCKRVTMINIHRNRIATFWTVSVLSGLLCLLSRSITFVFKCAQKYSQGNPTFPPKASVQECNQLDSGDLSRPWRH